MLEEQRGLARIQLADNLITAGGTNLCDYGCRWSRSYVYAYMPLLEREDLWPGMLSRVSISEAIMMADGMPDPEPQESSIECRSSRYHLPPPDRQSRHLNLNTFDVKIGLCLRCVQLDTTESHCSDHNS